MVESVQQSLRAYLDLLVRSMLCKETGDCCAAHVVQAGSSYGICG